MNLETYIKVAKREVDFFKGRGGEPGVIEFHLKNAIEEKEKIQEQLKQLEEFIYYLKLKQENLED